MVHVYQWYVCTNGTCVPMVQEYQWYGGINEKNIFSFLPFSLPPSLSLSLFLSPDALSHHHFIHLLHTTVISLQYYITFITLYFIDYL